jgi:RNA polymerase sigma factor (sigma-70 family)
LPPPPPPQGLASRISSRIFLGPALRTQPDRRLVALVRAGYEIAFEEIVRRYAKTLGRYAAAIVPRHRAEDVTQDAFSKALLALRGTDSEIELRPWLFRIVRNTALNDLRDQPPPAQELPEDRHPAASAFEEAARRAELADLMQRLKALPEAQRAAIVMRELEGLSHEEIAAALGITGGAARQVIYRARRALRDGIGLLVPLPLLKLMMAGGAAAPAGASGAAFGGTTAAGGTGVAAKAAAASILVAGTVGTGIALQDRNRVTSSAAEGSAPPSRSSGTPEGDALPSAALAGDAGPIRFGDGAGSGGSGDGGSDSSGPGGGGHSGPGSGEPIEPEDSDGDGSGDSGSGSSGSDSSGSGSGSSGSGSSGSGSSDSSGSGSSGSNSSGSSRSGSLRSSSDSSGSGSSGSGSDSFGSGFSRSGSGSSGSGSEGSDSSGSGDALFEPTIDPDPRIGD